MSKIDGRRVRVTKGTGRQKCLVGQEATLCQSTHFSQRDFIVQLKFDNGRTAWMDKTEFVIL